MDASSLLLVNCLGNFELRKFFENKTCIKKSQIIIIIKRATFESHLIVITLIIVFSLCN